MGEDRAEEERRRDSAARDDRAQPRKNYYEIYDTGDIVSAPIAAQFLINKATRGTFRPSCVVTSRMNRATGFNPGWQCRVSRRC